MCIIIGLTGLSGSGKSEIANYLENKKKCEIIRLGAYMRKLYMEECYMGRVEEYAERFRFNSVAEYLVEDINRIKDNKKIIIVDSLRTVADYNFFKGVASYFKLIMVLANRDKRVERLSNRKRIDDRTDELKLQEHDYWEMSFGIDKLMVVSDKLVINNGSIEELNKEIELYLISLEQKVGRMGKI